MKNKKQTRFVKIDPRHCAACWECVATCPEQIIGQVAFLWHRHVVLRDPEKCIGCKKCIKTCPHQVFSER